MDGSKRGSTDGFDDFAASSEVKRAATFAHSAKPSSHHHVAHTERDSDFAEMDDDVFAAKSHPSKQGRSRPHHSTESERTASRR